jgi:hypothetical protein
VVVVVVPAVVVPARLRPVERLTLLGLSQEAAVATVVPVGSAVPVGTLHLLAAVMAVVPGQAVV